MKNPMSKAELYDEMGKLINDAYRRGWQDCLKHLQKFMIETNGSISEMKLQLPSEKSRMSANSGHTDIKENGPNAWPDF